MWASGRVSSLRRYCDRRQRGGITGEPTEATDVHFYLRRIDKFTVTEIHWAVLALQRCHRRYVPVGGAGRYGIALYVLLSRRQSQKMAHGKEISGAGESTAGCPAETQKASSYIEHATAIVELCIQLSISHILEKRIVTFRMDHCMIFLRCLKLSPTFVVITD